MGNISEYENVDKALASRLSTLRKNRGLSLDQAAELSGVSRATLSRTERAETSPTAHEASILAWKGEMKHLLAQKAGIERWYEHYELRVAKVERAYNGPQGRFIG